MHSSVRSPSTPKSGYGLSLRVGHFPKSVHPRPTAPYRLAVTESWLRNTFPEANAAALPKTPLDRLVAITAPATACFPVATPTTTPTTTPPAERREGDRDTTFERAPLQLWTAALLIAAVLVVAAAALLS